MPDTTPPHPSPPSDTPPYPLTHLGSPHFGLTPISRIRTSVFSYLLQREAAWVLVWEVQQKTYWHRRPRAVLSPARTRGENDGSSAGKARPRSHAARLALPGPRGGRLRRRCGHRRLGPGNGFAHRGHFHPAQIQGRSLPQGPHQHG